MVTDLFFLFFFFFSSFFQHTCVPAISNIKNKNKSKNKKKKTKNKKQKKKKKARTHRAAVSQPYPVSRTTRTQQAICHVHTLLHYQHLIW